MKTVLLCVCALALALPAAASANDRPPGNDEGLPGCEPSHQTPKKCRPPHPGGVSDGIIVVNEPPGPNCATGGIKVTVVKGKPDADAVDEDENGRKIDPPDEVFFVCNGALGPQGPPGPGVVVTVEAAGANCLTGGIKIVTGGQTFFVCNGLNGLPGPAGPPGPAGQPRTCTSRRSFTIALPARFRGSQRVVAFVASHPRVLTVLPGRRVRISFVGIRAQQGRVVAVAIWGRKDPRTGLRPRLLRLYTLCANEGVGQINVPPRGTS